MANLFSGEIDLSNEKNLDLSEIPNEELPNDLKDLDRLSEDHYQHMLQLEEDMGQSDNLGQWREIETDLSMLENLKATNPNYPLGREWKINCQHCVPTYEMRQRGFDVTAKPLMYDLDYLAIEPFDAWKNPEVYTTKDDGMKDIEETMKNWGDGARAQIVVYWEYGGGGHTFIAEQRDGVTYFIDPQNGLENVSDYFEDVKPNCTQFCRIDNLQPSQWILDCCE